MRTWSALYTVDILGIVIQTDCHWLLPHLTSDSSVGEGTSTIACLNDVQIPAWDVKHLLRDKEP